MIMTDLELVVLQWLICLTKLKFNVKLSLWDKERLMNGLPRSLSTWMWCYQCVDICNGSVFINFSEYFANRPNGGSSSCKLKGKDDYLDLYYVALKYAVEAALEVGFVAACKKAKVFGSVMAYYGINFCYDCDASERSPYTAMLFEIKKPSHIEPGCKINLTRSTLGVPAQYFFIIRAKLHDFTSGDMILSGICEFLVPVDGSSSVGFINGNDCSLKVKVDWKLPIHV